MDLVCLDLCTPVRASRLLALNPADLAAIATEGVGHLDWGVGASQLGCQPGKSLPPFSSLIRAEIRFCFHTDFTSNHLGVCKFTTCGNHGIWVSMALVSINNSIILL